jgi:hypothetical protein
VYIGFRGIILRIDEPPRSIPEIVPGMVRLLSVVTGCFTAVAGCLVVGLFFSIPPIILVLGGIVQPYLRAAGKWFMAIGATLLSLEVIVLVPAIPDGIKLLHLHHDRNFLAAFLFSIISVLLVALCDVALVIDARQPRQTS